MITRPHSVGDTSRSGGVVHACSSSHYPKYVNLVGHERCYINNMFAYCYSLCTIMLLDHIIHVYISYGFGFWFLVFFSYFSCIFYGNFKRRTKKNEEWMWILLIIMKILYIWKYDNMLILHTYVYIFNIQIIAKKTPWINVLFKCKMEKNSLQYCVHTWEHTKC